jgi:stalled ribosome alternative rescue factor ArfA
MNNVLTALVGAGFSKRAARALIEDDLLRCLVEAHVAATGKGRNRKATQTTAKATTKANTETPHAAEDRKPRRRRSIPVIV